MDRDIYQEIEYEDLTNDLKLLSNIAGIDTVRVILSNFGGMSFYIPCISRLDNFIIRFIKENPKLTIKEIAKILRVSEQFIRSIKRNNKLK